MYRAGKRVNSIKMRLWFIGFVMMTMGLVATIFFGSEANIVAVPIVIFGIMLMCIGGYIPFKEREDVYDDNEN